MFLERLPLASMKIAVVPTPVVPRLRPVRATDEPKPTRELSVSNERRPFDIFNAPVTPEASVQVWAWIEAIPAVSKTKLPLL